ncbi:lamin tail domain-containing protein [Candidatus Saccharibacteria bacterium]|nr:lamin tail domain-containing protein [Candidatus Saccharibacteria bacterium]
MRKRYVLSLLAIIFAASLFAAQPSRAIEVTDPPVPAYYAPVFATGLQVTDQLDAVELYNESSLPIDLSSWSIQYQSLMPGQVCKITLQDWLPAGGYIVAVAADGPLTGLANNNGNVLLYDSCLRSLASDFKLTLYDGDVPQDIITPTLGTFVRKGLTKTYRTNKFGTDFTLINRSLYAGEWYQPPELSQLQFSEILANSRNCSPLETSLDCNDYVKLYNPTEQVVDLSSFRVRNGYLGQSPSSSNAITLDGVVEPGHFVIIPMTVTNSASWLWLEDMYGVKRYDNTIQDYPDASSDTKKGQAWAYDTADGTWKWTSQPTPFDIPSVFPIPIVEQAAEATTLPTPCNDGQYRSEVTNRCRVIEVAASDVTACKEGQYRSEETNRCRSVVSAVASLISCTEGQERNPQTNRCRQLVIADTELVPCKEGQERNLETNRCRNVTSTVPVSSFAVEPIVDTPGTFVGWWALGGVGMFALVYGVWEWRAEVTQATQKLRSFFHSNK